MSAFINGERQLVRKTPSQRKVTRQAYRTPKRLIEQSKPGPCYVIGPDGQRSRYVKPEPVKG